MNIKEKDMSIPKSIFQESGILGIIQKLKTEEIKNTEDTISKLKREAESFSKKTAELETLIPDLEKRLEELKESNVPIEKEVTEKLEELNTLYKKIFIGSKKNLFIKNASFKKLPENEQKELLNKFITAFKFFNNDEKFLLF
jgi:septal ring factor EnvC (AmiA/AmiB activator)